jgi:hypothetical protein
MQYAVPTGSAPITLLSALAARYTGDAARGWEEWDGLDIHPPFQISDRFGYSFGKTRDKWVLKCNWKFVAEQFASDMYHADLSHASALMVMAPEGVQVSGVASAVNMSNAGRQFSSDQCHGTGFFSDESG